MTLYAFRKAFREIDHPRFEPGHSDEKHRHGGEFAPRDASGGAASKDSGPKRPSVENPGEGTSYKIQEPAVIPPRDTGPGASAREAIQSKAKRYMYSLDRAILTHPGGDYEVLYKYRRRLFLKIAKAMAKRLGTSSAADLLVLREKLSDHRECWAVTSGDTDRRALTLQMTAGHIFGCADRAFEVLRERCIGDEMWKKATRWTMDQAPTLEAMVHGVYEETQASLKKAGITHVLLYRGVALDPDKDPVGARLDRDNTETIAAEVDMQPLSSYSNNRLMARSFALDNDRHGVPVVVETLVPASRIFSTPITGFGCLGESEWIVIDGPTQGLVRHADAIKL